MNELLVALGIVLLVYAPLLIYLLVELANARACSGDRVARTFVVTGSPDRKTMEQMARQAGRGSSRDMGQ